MSDQADDAIPGDSKDWTWVLERRCEECGFDTTTVRPENVAGLIRANAVEWPDLLADPRARRRPSPKVWSALEYGCHVRDVLRLFDRRLDLMLTEADPVFANWDQDETAIQDRYTEQDPSAVANDLTEAGERLAAHLERVSGPQWQRPGRRSDGAHFTVDTFARYLIHDPVHHVHDVHAAYRAIGG